MDGLTVLIMVGALATFAAICIFNWPLGECSHEGD